MSRPLAQPAPDVNHDPLSCGYPLPLHVRFHPMGYPVDIFTNSQTVLRAASELWACYPRVSGGASATVRIAVAGSGVFPVTGPAMVGQEHLVTFIGGRDNFAVCDLSRSFTFAWLTNEVAANETYLQYHYLEPLVYLMLNAAYLTPVHASSIALDGRAILLSGDSGSGKTSLAYAAARRGWTYLSDDATHLVRDPTDYSVVGRPYRIRFRESARRLFPELNEYVPVRRPNGKLDIEVATAELGIRVAQRSRATHLVFLRRVAGLKYAQLNPFSLEEAGSRLEQVISCGDEPIRSAQREGIQRLLRLPVFELTYEDLASAEACLRSLIDRRSDDD